MTVEENKEDLYRVRIYLKSGNVIDLFNLTSFKYEQNAFGKSLNWKHHPDDDTFNLLGGGTLNLDQIEAVTSRKQQGFVGSKD
jgi:hypothetical protein